MSAKWRPVVGSSKMMSCAAGWSPRSVGGGSEELAEFEALGFAT